MYAKNVFIGFLTGAPDRNRTDDQRFRKPLLYPTELRGHIVLPFNIRHKLICVTAKYYI